eukprot:CAMPEP_0113424590 /NCGR_PEP_ID=MMETSP0013_2-20120614/29681_1 /TAXON_ID=2843 ORGANISM="Skeletonema costatum, Strain 1716" /NCGR_SAMPLE_ID=MMETSP0013_2 /ASSEMBLY_ACC=CAM_ASM_000158 /LENGTH=223 /DNA_ID=CAMNT_0000312623 /DNA_START=57 /DNA_END=725 /DNA_ORIENTATION=- /assembly_acc=CAM_ASM_000158
MKNHIGNKRTTHLVLAFLVSIIALEKQCQAAAAAASNRRNNNAAAFIIPSSPLSASTTASINRRSINFDYLQRTSVLHTTTSLSMTTLFDSSTSSLIAATQVLVDSTTTTIIPQPPQLEEAPLVIEQLSPTTTLIVFIIGIIPFIWATIEFWRRIAVGASFGTGSDSVVIPSPFDDTGDDDSGLITIGEDGNPTSSRGRQTLDRGALGVAYVLFAVAAFSVGI